MIIQQWKTKPSFVFPYLLQKKTVDAAYANGRQALPSDSCCFEVEKIGKLICVEICLDRVVGALKRLQGSHTCKRAELNAYADVKPASACTRVRTEELMKPERTSRVLQPLFWPNRISVSNRSPTMHIWDVVIPNLSCRWRNVRIWKLAVSCMIYYT